MSDANKTPNLSLDEALKLNSAKDVEIAHLREQIRALSNSQSEDLATLSTSLGDTTALLADNVLPPAPEEERPEAFKTPPQLPPKGNLQSATPVPAVTLPDDIGPSKDSGKTVAPTWAGVAGRKVKVRCVDLVKALDRKEPLEQVPDFVFKKAKGEDFQKRLIPHLEIIQKTLNLLIKRDLDMYHLQLSLAKCMDSTLSGHTASNAPSLEPNALTSIQLEYNRQKNEEELLKTKKQLKINGIPLPEPTSNGQALAAEEELAAIDVLLKYDKDITLNDIEKDEDGKSTVYRIKPRNKKDNGTVPALIVPLKTVEQAKKIDEAYKKEYYAKIDEVGLANAGKRQIQICMTKMQRQAHSQAIKEVNENNRRELEENMVENLEDLEEIWIIRYPDGNPIPTKVFNKKFFDYRPKDEFVNNKAEIRKARRAELKKKQDNYKKKRAEEAINILDEASEHNKENSKDKRDNRKISGHQQIPGLDPKAPLLNPGTFGRLNQERSGNSEPLTSGNDVNQNNSINNHRQQFQPQPKVRGRGRGGRGGYGNPEGLYPLALANYQPISDPYASTQRRSNRNIGKPENYYQSNYRGRRF